VAETPRSSNASFARATIVSRVRCAADARRADAYGRRARQAKGERMRSAFLAAIAVVALLALTAGSAFAGEITGNGRSITGSNATLNGKSDCAYSGQEDLQYVDANGNPLAVATKGVPGHAQSWGQLDQATRAFLTSIGLNPGIACNPTNASGGAYPARADGYKRGAGVASRFISG
jgi:hypothetical protein